MLAWASRVVSSLDRPSLVFAQECHDDWLRVWADAGYQVILGDAEGQPQYKVRSAILAERTLGLSRAEVEDVPTLAYHGSYIAAARWEVGNDRVLLMSVHASPNRAEKYLGDWPESAAGPVARAVERRPGGGNRLWNADALLATLRHRARLGPILAVGDFNEALGWDRTHGGVSGRDYFDAVREAGLTSVLHDLWGLEERATHRVNGKAGLQLDHIVASPLLAVWISDPQVDAGWLAALDHDDWSDHAPVWFSL